MSGGRTCLWRKNVPGTSWKAQGTAKGEECAAGMEQAMEKEARGEVGGARGREQRAEREWL